MVGNSCEMTIRQAEVHQTQESVGTLVRRWRQRRRRSQLDVSLAADVSARHLSFVETGRAMPSREMIERLCEELEVPLRERNVMHLAAGFAPTHQERPLADLASAREAVDVVLAGHVPYPAVAVDVYWNLVAANSTMAWFLASVPEHLRTPRLNMLRATLHPDGLAPQLRNYEQWRAHVVRRVRRQLARTAASGLSELLAEIESYPVRDGAAGDSGCIDDMVVPMVLATEYGDLSLTYVLSVFGAPRDVTLDEIAIESFFPADEPTRRLLLELTDNTTETMRQTSVNGDG
jgi:transcriptional regulator with XRE-family HTH domain